MLGRGVLAGDPDVPGSFCLFTGLSSHFCHECQPVVWRNTAPFPQSLLECGNCSGLREKKKNQYFWRKASSHPLKICFLLKMKLSPGVAHPQGRAAGAAARCWGPPWCRPGGGHSPPGTTAVGPPASSAALWGVGQQQALIPRTHIFDKPLLNCFTVPLKLWCALDFTRDQMAFISFLR